MHTENGVPVESEFDHCYVCNKPVGSYVREEMRGIGDRLTSIVYRLPDDENEEEVETCVNHGGYSRCEICQEFFHNDCDAGWHTDDCSHMCGPCYEREVELGNAEEEGFEDEEYE